MLVHGAADTRRSFLPLRARLARDHRVVVYDRRGYARSRALGPARDVAQHVTDLLDLLGGRRALVFGHSFGGLVALGAAARAPECVATVVAYEPPAGWRDWWYERSGREAAPYPVPGEDPSAFAARFLSTIVGTERFARLPAKARAELGLDGPAVTAELRAMRTGAPFSPEAVAVPTVLARGTASFARHRRSAGELAAAIPGARLVELEGAAHDAHLSHPDELAALLRRLHAPSGPDN